MSTSDDKSSAAISLTVHGMTCAGCSRTVERVLIKEPGINHAEVDLEAERALIRGRFDPEVAIASLRAAGFEAALGANTSGYSA